MVQLKCKTTSLNIIMTFSFMLMFKVSVKFLVMYVEMLRCHACETGCLFYRMFRVGHC